MSLRQIYLENSNEITAAINTRISYRSVTYRISSLLTFKMVKMEKETKVGVQFDGKLIACSVTKYTTCDDVTEMVLYSSFNTTNDKQYALFETAHGVERMLTGKSPILKVIRSWGTKKSDVSLLVKQADFIIQKKIKMSKAMKKLEKIKSLLMANKAETGKANDTVNNNMEKNVHKTNVYDKCVRIETKDTSKCGKLDLMKRYLNDIANHSGNITSTEIEDVYSSTEQESRHGHGLDLDTAFIGDYTSVLEITDTLNDCMIYDLDTSECDLDTSDTESAFYESCSSDNELERNVFEDDIVVNSEDVDKLRNLFVQGGDTYSSSYDKAMASFMETMNCNHDNDEGLSSMASDV